MKFGCARIGVWEHWSGCFEYWHVRKRNHRSIHLKSWNASKEMHSRTKLSTTDKWVVQQRASNHPCANMNSTHFRQLWKDEFNAAGLMINRYQRLNINQVKWRRSAINGLIYSKSISQITQMKLHPTLFKYHNLITEKSRKVIKTDLQAEFTWMLDPKNNNQLTIALAI